MTASARSLSRPALGPVPRPAPPRAVPRTVNAGQLSLCALASAPFWARQYTRLFLAGCSSIMADVAETAQLIVSELVTNAARASTDDLAAPRPSYSQRVGAGVICLSLRLFHDGLLIEVSDASPGTPVSVRAGSDTEHGRGLMLVDALSQDWGYYPRPRGGKVVYSFLRLS